MEEVNKTSIKGNYNSRRTVGKYILQLSIDDVILNFSAEETLEII
jgi:hypothetical protein